MSEITIQISTGQYDPESEEARDKIAGMYVHWAHCNDMDWWHAGGDTLIIEGEDLSGLRQEHGMHRIMRINPHDPEHRRCTTFVEVRVQGAPGDPKDILRRSYVFAPHRGCRDHISGKQVEDVDYVLAGHPEVMWVSPSVR